MLLIYKKNNAGLFAFSLTGCWGRYFQNGNFALVFSVVNARGYKTFHNKRFLCFFSSSNKICILVKTKPRTLWNQVSLYQKHEWVKSTLITLIYLIYFDILYWELCFLAKQLQNDHSGEMFYLWKSNWQQMGGLFGPASSWIHRRWCFGCPRPEKILL